MHLRPRVRDCDVVFWDEGAVHAAHNLFVHAGSAPRREEIGLFATVVPKPDVLVWVTAPVAQSLAVTLRRGHDRVRGPAASARTFVERGQEAFTELCSADGVRERLLCVDNSASAQGGTPAAVRERARAIAESLKKHLAQRRPRHGAGRHAR
jgi:hypothetical protein